MNLARRMKCFLSYWLLIPVSFVIIKRSYLLQILFFFSFTSFPPSWLKEEAQQRKITFCWATISRALLVLEAIKKCHQGEKQGNSGTSWCKIRFGIAQRCLTPTTHQSKPRMQYVMPCMIDLCLWPKPPTEGGVSADFVFFSLYRDFVILYIDIFNGVNLHKRVYKDVMHHASLNEKNVVAIFTIDGWNSIVLGLGEINQNFGFTIEGGVFLEYFRIFTFVEMFNRLFNIFNENMNLYF